MIDKTKSTAEAWDEFRDALRAVVRPMYERLKAVPPAVFALAAVCYVILLALAAWFSR